MATSVVGLCRQDFFVATAFVGLCRQHCVLATALLDESEGLGFRSPCGRLVLTLFGSFFRRQHSLVATALLDD